MTVRSHIKASAYFDSVRLMLVQREVRALPGVREAGAVMGTEANKELLRDAGLMSPEASRAGPDDLILCVDAVDVETAEAALARAEGLLVQRRTSTTDTAYRPKTVASAARMLSGANLTLISVPGRFAAGVAAEALDAGLHVMLFSDNVPLEAEVTLKRRAASLGRLVMGPDCGTAILGGAALGFANHVRRGSIGIVGAAGTGIQEVTSLIHRGGAGISHAIGTGGRDLRSEVGGATAMAGLAALGVDPLTEVIVLLSKPPAAEVASRLLGAARATGKPVVVNFVGAAVEPGERVFPTQTLEDAAELAVQVATGSPPRWPRREALPAQEAMRLAPGQRYVRGLYSGGTLCYEALLLLERFIGPVHSNTPLDPAQMLVSAHRSIAHTVVDLGSDEFTVGRLHPMLDPDVRLQRLLREADDPEVAVILLDVVLGYGAHPNPAGVLAPVIRETRGRARAAGRWLSVVASVCGTEEDPQAYDDQVAQLIESGALVQASNAQAARLAGLIAQAAGASGQARPLVPVALPATMPGPPAPPLAPGAAEIVHLLAGPVKVVNVGLGLFADALRAQSVEVISVDWQPPAGGKQHLIDILDRLGA
ncbi:MAG TPA: acyl-CoA synthetase FdrA [bacterium]|nr:acyl-CoA synthetase FdrA [bacterium]